jgi:hypothetical protein
VVFEENLPHSAKPELEEENRSLRGNYQLSQSERVRTSVVSVPILRRLAVCWRAVHRLHSVARERGFGDDVDELIIFIEPPRDIDANHAHAVLCGLFRIEWRIGSMQIEQHVERSQAWVPCNQRALVLEFPVLLRVDRLLGVQGWF